MASYYRAIKRWGDDGKKEESFSRDSPTLMPETPSYTHGKEQLYTKSRRETEKTENQGKRKQGDSLSLCNCIMSLLKGRESANFLCEGPGSTSFTLSWATCNSILLLEQESTYININM